MVFSIAFFKKQYRKIFFVLEKKQFFFIPCFFHIYLLYYR